jgi:hypothetical protein
MGQYIIALARLAGSYYQKLWIETA